VMGRRNAVLVGGALLLLTARSSECAKVPGQPIRLEPIRCATGPSLAS
jgi:hypothetical protein